MKASLRYLGAVAVVAIALFSCVVPNGALAGTTGTISGTVTDSSSGAPISGATVTATSPSDRASTTTDSHGFYVLQQLSPDTYTLGVKATGFEDYSQSGVIVFQDQSTPGNVKIVKGLVTIASVTSRSSASLVQPNVTSDTYTVSQAQLNAISLGNDTHKTLYQYVSLVPGITGNTYGSQPRVHGGSAADISYEFDGVPINDEMTGLFTTNLSATGIGSMVISTGGLSAANAASGIGIINTVAKTGTYPGFSTATYAATSKYRNVYQTFELGGATPNNKYSWYFSVDNTDALNEYTSGQTYPLELIEQNNGPGVVTTTDIIANFHYRPTDKDNVQLLMQNGMGEFNFDYLMQRAPGEPVPLTVNMCPGAQAYTNAQLAANQAGLGSNKYNNTNAGTTLAPNWVLNNTYTGGYGGFAPNGQYCPEGLYFGNANTQVGGGNIWHHYSGIGKLQWNHLVSNHSSLTATLSENFNQYVFDQPVADANLPQFQNNSAVDVSATCPLYPYAAGTPVISGTNFSTVTINGKKYQQPRDVACMQLTNWVSTGFWEDRSSHIWTGALKYDNALNENTDIEVGASYDYSPNHYDAFFDGWFNTPGSWSSIWPGLNYDTSFPTHTWSLYAQGDIRAKKWKLSPGLRYTRRKYSYPLAGGAAGDAIVPTFAFNYQAGPRDVIIGSVTDSNSLVASAYTYRYGPPSMLNGPRTSGLYYCSPQNLTPCGSSPVPTLTHSYNLMWEHQIGANTSFKFGPYVNVATNILTNFVPLFLDTTQNPPVYKAVPATAAGITSNNGIRKTAGLELGINHLDPRSTGLSWWVAGTWDNFWTNTSSSVLTPYGTVALPPSTNQLFRSSQDPPFSGSVTLDYHKDRFHFYPQWYVQSGDTQYTSTAISSSTGNISTTKYTGPGWGQLNATVSYDVGPGKSWTAGLQVINLLSNNSPTLPTCTTPTAIPSANLGVGCGALRPIAPDTAPGATAGAHNAYLTINQSSPLWLFFLTKRL